MIPMPPPTWQSFRRSLVCRQQTSARFSQVERSRLRTPREDGSLRNLSTSSGHMRSRQAPGSSWLRRRRTASLICWPLKPKLLLLWPLRVAVRFPTVGAAENSPAKPASTLTLSSPAWCSSLPQATSREQRGLALLPTLLQPAARQSAGIPLPWRLSPSVPGLKLAVVAACSNPSRPIKLPLPASSDAHAACLTCPSMLILIQVSGYLTVHQLKARPPAVAGSRAGGSWVELACHRRHWRAWPTQLAISLPPAKTS